jgi:NADPH:quinone reductase-like Zn-dependent oxidoreductase
MKAAVVHSFGAPPRYEDFADPVAAEGEVMITVKAAGFHRIVKALASGTHYGSTGELPMVPGVDGVGLLPDGKRVYFGGARSPYGTFEELCAVPRKMCLPLPEGLDDALIAGMANPGMSSWAALQFRAQLVAGESVLILGATGVAGQLAVQIARRLGASRVVAAGRNPAALDELKQLGADAVISLSLEPEALVKAFREEIEGHKTNVILDYVWGAPAESALAAIAQKGLKHLSHRIRYVQIGNSAGPTISLAGATLRSSGLELIGSGFGSVPIEKIFQSVAEFVNEVARKPFDVKVERAPLSEVETRWNAPDQGGRLVFIP